MLAVLLRKREIKAMRELDIYKFEEDKTQRINDTSFSSFFKITTQYDKFNEETRGDTIIDPNFTIYQYRCTYEEYYLLCTQKLDKDTAPFKPSRATRLGFNSHLNNQIYDIPEVTSRVPSDNSVTTDQHVMSDRHERLVKSLVRKPDIYPSPLKVRSSNQKSILSSSAPKAGRTPEDNPLIILPKKTSIICTSNEALGNGNFLTSFRLNLSF